MNAHNVTVYVSNQCNQSDMLISFLDYLEIDYIKKNTSENKNNLKELQQNNVFATPTTFVDDYKVLGFQKHKLKQLLGVIPSYKND